MEKFKDVYKKCLENRNFNNDEYEQAIDEINSKLPIGICIVRFNSIIWGDLFTGEFKLRLNGLDMVISEFKFTKIVIGVDTDGDEYVVYKLKLSECEELKFLLDYLDVDDLNLYFTIEDINSSIVSYQSYHKYSKFIEGCVNSGVLREFDIE
jgi:hypothetical protein